MSTSVMPQRIDLGSHYASTVGHAVLNHKIEETPNKHNYRTVMGFFIPTWQRGLVWEETRQVNLVESLWRGIPIGTYTYNVSEEFGGRLDNILIDGQQRLNALQRYLDDEFKVFGHKWSELTKTDQRMFTSSRSFPCYVTRSENEQYLREYYDMTNFGGVAHTEDQRAVKGN